MEKTELTKYRDVSGDVDLKCKEKVCCPHG